MELIFGLITILTILFTISYYLYDKFRLRCPDCDSTKIDDSNFRIDNDGGLIRHTCKVCGKEWA